MAPSWVIYGDEPQPGPGPASTFEPINIAGLQVWLDASYAPSVTLVGADVSQWSDRSGQTRHATQGTSGLRPQYATGRHNGRNMIDYITNIGRYLDIGIFNLSQPFTVFGFAQTTVAEFAAYCFDNTSGTNRVSLSANNSTNRFGMYAGAGPAMTGNSYRVSKYTVFVGVFNGASSEIFVNGVSEQAADAGSNNMTSMRIGCTYNVAAPLKGYFGELGVYNSALSGANLTKLTDYLMNKWAPDVQLPMSLVLTASSSQYLSRTWNAVPDYGRTATIAFWFKRSANQNTNMFIYDGGNGTGTLASGVRFNAANNLCQVTIDDASSTVSEYVSASAYTDTNWHHACIILDSTQVAAADKVHIFVDGVEVSYSTQTGITTNTDYRLSESGVASRIGGSGVFGQNFDGQLAYCYFVDGDWVYPYEFTTGTGAGTIHPKVYSYHLGTNGFFLDFTSGATTDQSGHGRDWTPSGSPTFSTDIPT